MSKRLEFFYDYVSPYSYLANSQVEGLDAEIVYRPMFLGAVMRATGNSPPKNVKAKGDYLDRDLARWVARYSIPYRMNPIFPQNTVNALRLAIVAQHDDCFRAVHEALFDAMWVHGKNLSTADCLAEIAAAAGMSGASLLRIGTDEIKDELRANTEEAIARGTFGAPTFYVDDEMFFGNDRFDFIRDAIGQRSQKDEHR
jgi:2-hydroxychromene-2-carboxylate isomerase